MFSLKRLLSLKIKRILLKRKFIHLTKNIQKTTIYIIIFNKDPLKSASVRDAKKHPLVTNTFLFHNKFDNNKTNRVPF